MPQQHEPHSIDHSQLKKAFVALMTAGEYTQQLSIAHNLCRKCKSIALDFIPATDASNCVEPMTLEGAEALADKAIRDAWLLCTSEAIPLEHDPVDFINEAVEDAVESSVEDKAAV